ncbi:MULTISPECIES: hypothetical protein [Cupriavidus]|uniref:hypothetical protein n=1 Tax=Cupriavidus TaxID=106589 RepID=UPI001E4676D1|nr:MULTISPECIES: hypothetical protein [Cupriavidus]MCD9121270.1 hypothetical protein [Cupriavidus sp. UGS-1]MCT9015448.1 hypothetical protein [Cupriavidus gilardii]MCT9055218.1 hypothetical protein [Cupriavidus gilardii]UXC34467.1 hypothetical protein N4G38_08285 [Cupriavidus gilardii]WNG71799.1 hypothetical protein QWJ31_16995 [Cupriavidus gilardii]
MIPFRFSRSFAIAIGAAALFSGCASTGSTSGPQSEEAFTQSMAQADAALKGGQREQAVSLYEEIAKANPARQEPWSQIAQIQYADEKYPQAILAAEEALQRDSNDRKAKSILAVSGLRVARRSVMELRDDSALAGDVRTDAQVLAKMLRETLGEQVLFPEEKKPPVRKRPVARPAPRAKAAPAEQAAPAAAPAAANAGGGSADPFGALR